MDVRCERCETEYELDDTMVTEVGVSVQCTTCGHTFVLASRVLASRVVASRVETSQASSSVTHMGLTPPEGMWESRAPAAPEWTLSTDDGKVHRFRDLHTLQKWIVERKVCRTERICRGGGPWMSLENVADLTPFFNVVDEADRARAMTGDLRWHADSAEIPTAIPGGRRFRGGHSAGEPGQPKRDLRRRSHAFRPPSNGESRRPMSTPPPVPPDARRPVLEDGPTVPNRRLVGAVSATMTTVTTPVPSLTTAAGELTGRGTAPVAAAGISAVISRAIVAPDGLASHPASRAALPGMREAPLPPPPALSQGLTSLDVPAMSADVANSASSANSAIPTASLDVAATGYPPGAVTIGFFFHSIQSNGAGHGAWERTTGAQPHAGVPARATTPTENELGRVSRAADPQETDRVRPSHQGRNVVIFGVSLVLVAGAVGTWWWERRQPTPAAPTRDRTVAATGSSSSVAHPPGARALGPGAVPSQDPSGSAGAASREARSSTTTPTSGPDRNAAGKPLDKPIDKPIQLAAGTSVRTSAGSSGESASATRGRAASRSATGTATRASAGPSNPASFAAPSPGTSAARTPRAAAPVGGGYERLVAEGTSSSIKVKRRAQTVFMRKLAARPDGVAALTGSAYVHLDRRRHPKAIEMFRRALAAQPTFGPALFGLAESYRARGDGARALGAYRQYLALAPAGDEASTARRRIEELEVASTGSTRDSSAPKASETKASETKATETKATEPPALPGPTAPPAAQ